MILAAGRGERMRPLSDAIPKPLLGVHGKPLISWQIERLVAAGFDDLVINVAHLGDKIMAACGDGRSFGATIRYSRESHPLEVAGGISTALPLLSARAAGVALVVSSDIYTDYDYASLRARVEAMEAASAPPHAHMVMVANPPYHLQGDFCLADGRLTLGGGGGVGVGDDAVAPRLTFGNIALYRTSLFRELPRGVRLQMLPLYRGWIARDWVSGEFFDGRWANVGTPSDLTQLDAELRAGSPT